MTTGVDFPRIGAIDVNSIIEDLYRESGKFIVLLGVERCQEGRIEQYQIGIFDSGFRGAIATPEHLLRIKRDGRDNRLFSRQQFFRVHFNYSQNESEPFYYATFHAPPEAIGDKERFYLEYCRVGRGLLEAIGFSGEELERRIRESKWLERGPGFERAFVYVQTPKIMTCGRVGKNLEQVQLTDGQIEEAFGLTEKRGVDKKLRFFYVLGEMFPQEKLGNYTPLKKELVLPEHREFEPIEEFYWRRLVGI